jgi:hypothetical protein
MQETSMKEAKLLAACFVFGNFLVQISAHGPVSQVVLGFIPSRQNPEKHLRSGCCLPYVTFPVHFSLFIPKFHRTADRFVYMLSVCHSGHTIWSNMNFTLFFLSVYSLSLLNMPTISWHICNGSNMFLWFLLSVFLPTLIWRHLYLDPSLPSQNYQALL